MSDKILKSYTIVPQHLYVRREADRLIEFIIGDTGRPGYVLVARQMGKTNLLLNAKDNLIGSDDVSVYIDFSNSFRSAKECFRHIIDLIIETNYEKLYFLTDKIKDDRRNNDVVDHVEHLSELRTILRVIKGKLIIFIDEVDAITTVDFSDSIFKQIRSVYFSRANFPVLHKLNYILSGVGEPSELIKDPKISPFNIGQEIFLGDFSYNEYLEFVSRSKLSISNDVAERIYYWANGNPRMTYEICSAVEDIALEGENINADTIDSLINIMYLTTYDRVPLDNIRGVIQADPELVRAVKNIKAKQLSMVPTLLRKKLYLTGIVGVDFESDKIKIKNRIIEKTLSEDWLEQVSEDDNESMVDIITSAYSTGNYDQVIALIEKSIDKTSSESEFVILQQLIISSFHRKGNFADIIEHFSKHGLGIERLRSRKVKILKMDSLFLYASALLNDENYEKCYSVLSAVLNIDVKNICYFNSLLVMANIVSKINNLSENNEKPNYSVNNISTLSLYLNIDDELNSNDADLSDEEIKQLTFTVKHNLGKYHLDHDDNAKAVEYLKDTLVYAPDNFKASILYDIAIFGLDKLDNTIDSYIEISSLIISNKLNTRNYLNGLNFSIGYSAILNVLKVLMDNDYQKAFELIEYFYEEEAKAPIIQADLSLNNIEKVEMVSRDEIVVLSFDRFSSNMSLPHMKLGYSIFKSSKLISIAKGMSVLAALVEYKILPELDSVDVTYIITYIKKSIAANDVEQSKIAIEFLRKNYFSLSKNSEYERLVFDYYEMELMRSTSNLFEVYDKAKSILNNIKKLDTSSIDLLVVDKKNIDIIKTIAFKNYSELLTKYSKDDNSNIVDGNRRITVAYPDGRLLTDKLKRFEKDIKKGRCWVVGNSS